MPIERPSARVTIARSLVDLLRNSPFEKISIQEIVDNCGYSKRSFYNYFENKDDVMLYVFHHEVIDTFEKWFVPERDMCAYMLASFDSFSEFSPYLGGPMHVTVGGQTLRELTLTNGIDLFSNYIVETFGGQAYDERCAFSLEHYLQLCNDVIYDWYTGRVKTPKEDLARWCAEDMPETLRAYLM